MEPLSPTNTCKEDEWSNVSTMVPYKPVTSTSPVSHPILQEKQLPPVNKKRNKDLVFVMRMVKSLTRLERKYATPPHRRKARLFTRRPVRSSIIPMEFDSIYHDLAAPAPDPIDVPEPYLNIDWKDVKFKPSLPSPREFPILSASPDPGTYEDKPNYQGQLSANFALFMRQNPFGTLPGYETNRGVAAVPTVPVSGYVYSSEEKKWVLHATQGGTGRGGPLTSSGTRSRG